MQTFFRKVSQFGRCDQGRGIEHGDVTDMQLIPARSRQSSRDADSGTKNLPGTAPQTDRRTHPRSPNPDEQPVFSSSPPHRVAYYTPNHFINTIGNSQIKFAGVTPDRSGLANALFRPNPYFRTARVSKRSAHRLLTRAALTIELISGDARDWSVSPPPRPPGQIFPADAPNGYDSSMQTMRLS